MRKRRARRKKTLLNSHFLLNENPSLHNKAPKKKTFEDWFTIVRSHQDIFGVVVDETRARKYFAMRFSPVRALETETDLNSSTITPLAM
ncbi:MAG: hypothetical protein SGI71_00745 [Verrucomicrobiota bacterium]|nr:hypothetical protein [Verrucomicrobiota bacterium]